VQEEIVKGGPVNDGQKKIEAISGRNTPRKCPSQEKKKTL
jgi:hypothetical protein